MKVAWIVLAVALDVALFVLAVRLVWRFNARMPALWSLLEAKGRAQRVRELRDEPWSNLPSKGYLYNDVDFDDPEIRDLKLSLKVMHRNGILSLLAFIVVLTVTIPALS